MERSDTCDDLEEMREMVTSFNSDLAQEVASLGHISMPDFPELNLSCMDDFFQTETVRPLPSLLSPIHVSSKGDPHQKKHPSSIDLSGRGSSLHMDVAKPAYMEKSKPTAESVSKKKRTSEKSSHESSRHANPKGTSAMPRSKELKRDDFNETCNVLQWEASIRSRDNLNACHTFIPARRDTGPHHQASYSRHRPMPSNTLCHWH